MSKICIAYGFYIKKNYLLNNQKKIIDCIKNIRKNIVKCDGDKFNIKKFCNENHFELLDTDLNNSQTYYSLDNLNDDDLDEDDGDNSNKQLDTIINCHDMCEKTCKYNTLKFIIRNELEKIENNDLDIEYSNNHYYIFIKKTFKSTNITTPLLVNKSCDYSKNLSVLSRCLNNKDSNIYYFTFTL